MGANFQRILELVNQYPGNLAFHFVLTFSVVWAFQICQALRRNGSLPHSQRMFAGLGLLLFLRLVLILAALASGEQLLEGNFLPPLDRGLGLLSLIIIIWLLVFPEPKRLGDAATLLLGLLALTLLALGLVYWYEQGQDLAYNGSWLDRIGEAVTLAVIAIGLVLLLVRRPSSWGFGLAMLLTLALGHLSHLFLLTEPGNYSGAIRLAQVVAFSMLLFLPQRYHLPGGEEPSGAASTGKESRSAADVKLLQTLLSLSGEEEPGEACRGITRAVAQGMQADICLLAYPPLNNGQILFPCGIDLVQEVDFGPFSIPSSRVPVIDSVLRKGLPARRPASSTSPDLVSLVQALSLSRGGPFLVAPVLAPRALPAEGADPSSLMEPKPLSHTSEASPAFKEREASIPGEPEAPDLEETVMPGVDGAIVFPAAETGVSPPSGGEAKILAALILLSPYSDRTWEGEQDHAMQIAAWLAHLLQRTQVMETLQIDAETARQSLHTAQAEVETARHEREEALEKLLTVEELYQREHAQLVSLTALVKDQEEAGQAAEKNGTQTNLDLAEKERALAEANRGLAEAQVEIERLKSIHERQEKTEPVPARRRIQTENLEGELRLALEELEQMRVALAEAEQQTLAADQQTSLQKTEGLRESLAALALELREPVSVLFYQARGLLSGPVENLNEAQRKSLDEIMTSTHRVASMVDQLIRMTTTAVKSEVENGPQTFGETPR